MGSGLAASPSVVTSAVPALLGDSTSMEGFSESPGVFWRGFWKHALFGGSCPPLGRLRRPDVRSWVTGRLALQPGSSRHPACWKTCFTPHSSRLLGVEGALLCCHSSSGARSQGTPLRTYICYFHNFPGHAFCCLFAGATAFMSFGPSVDFPPFPSFLFLGGQQLYVCR